MNTLIYKRTHVDDPDKYGCFGLSTCMGVVRGYGFDSVIGIGGKNPWKGQEAIARKINWIGVGVHKLKNLKNPKAPFLTFDSFDLMNENGPNLEEVAPNLYSYLFGEHQRRWFIMRDSFPMNLQQEVNKILNAKRNKIQQLLP